MERTYVVTGAASGIGAATVRFLRQRGDRVIGSDLHHADVIADLTTARGRASLVEGIERLAEGRIDGVVANAGGGPPETSLQLNFFGTVATLEGLRPLLTASPAPRAVAVSSVAALRPVPAELVEACLDMDEGASIAVAKALFEDGRLQGAPENPLPASAQAPLDLYGAAKQALQLWCRKVAVEPRWAGSGIPLNVVALGFFDTPAAAYVLSNPDHREAMGRLVPLRGAFPGRPEEAAAILAWCVSPESSQMTGQVLYVDGGLECLALRGTSQ